jgi:hypothetical protein
MQCTLLTHICQITTVTATLLQVSIILTNFMPAADAEAASNKLREQCVEMMEPDEPMDEDEDAEDLCNCKFTLAYGESLSCNHHSFSASML